MDENPVCQDLGIQWARSFQDTAMAVEAMFRKPSEKEQALLNRLLEAGFPGRDELVPLLREVLVRTIDDNGGLELLSQIDGSAPVVKRVPVEAEAKDDDGAVIHMLLHIVEGRPAELEFYRDGVGNVQTMPQPSAFELIVLPPMPRDGYFARKRD
jgi:hypothetical protein